MTLFNPAGSFKVEKKKRKAKSNTSFFFPFTSPTGDGGTEQSVGEPGDGDNRVRGEAIRGAVMGSQVPFWEAAVGFFVGGLDCLNVRRRPCVSRLPILWEIRTREAVRLPGKIPRFQAQRTDILKCEAAEPPATSKGLTGGSDEADRSGKWVSFVKFSDLIASFLLPSLLPLQIHHH